MQAITTKVIPCTNTRPTRIKAECERGSITINYPDGAGEPAHRTAVNALVQRFAKEDAEKYGCPIASNPWLRPYTTGQVKSGDYVHVFTADATPLVEAIQAVAALADGQGRINLVQVAGQAKQALEAYKRYL